MAGTNPDQAPVPIKGDDGDHAQVAMHPPVLMLGGLIVACGLESAWPLGPGPFDGGTRAIGVGLGLFALAAAVVFYCAILFDKAGTTIPVHQPTSKLVTHGPYAVSRNPIYLALILAYCGLCIAATTMWGFILLPALVYVLTHGVIMREEAYLEGKFGDAYRAYLKRVPRWL